MVILIIIVIAVIVIDIIVSMLKTTRSIGKDLGFTDKQTDSLVSMFMLYNLFKDKDK